MNARGSRKYFGNGISFKTAARVFFDYDRIEMYDEEHSAEEDRYNTIGDASATPDERAELDRAKVMPITFDEDCPETTPERALRFRRVNPVRTVGTGG